MDIEPEIMDVDLTAAAADPDEPEPLSEDRRRQRAQDLATLARLRAAGFQGSAWQEFVESLFIYARRTLGKWITENTIWSHCKALRLDLPEDLTWRQPLPADRDDLVLDTLTNAIAAYRDRLRDDRWDPGRGASLRTYFVGQALIQFTAVYRRYHEDQKHLVLMDAEHIFSRGDVSAWSDPERALLTKEELREHLSRVANPRSQLVLVLDALGFSYADIADRTGLSIRAVEGRLRRARTLFGTRGDDSEASSSHAGRRGSRIA
jgi:DNA-directed RNA polymerase specialized sigma24 family protein